MKRSIIEVIKANKGTILKRALIVGGAVVGLTVVMAMAKSNDSEEVEVIEEVVETSNEDSLEV